MSDLAKLAQPFRDAVIKSNPSGGGQYVKHSIVNEKLLAIVGPFDYELVRVLRGDVAGIPPNPQGNSQRAKDGRHALTNVVVGCAARLTLDIDGKRVSIVEVGDCEDPHNWPHDGARLKDAMSDAFKRCAMRPGVGLHLWSQHDFTLYDALMRREIDTGAAASTTDVSVRDSLEADGTTAPVLASRGRAEPTGPNPVVSERSLNRDADIIRRGAKRAPQ